MKPFFVLGIETSCDDTALALLEARGDNFRILSSAISSQTAIHKKWGGVVPNLARREHEKNLPIVLKKVLAKAKFSQKLPLIDLIGVTSHPGLEIALWSGINFAMKLSQEWNVPLLGVDHLEGHLLVSLLEKKGSSFKLLRSPSMFPAIALIVSGGHTALFLMEGIGRYKMIGETRDDAAGECFDKTARLLGLGYPGGPAIEAAAAQKLTVSVALPRPMMYTKDYDFSFSGLKTAVLYDYQKRSLKEKKSKAYISTMASEIQQAICDVLVAKTLRAVKEYKARTVLLGGGVAANKRLRVMFKDRLQEEFPKVSFRSPSIPLCTDNGVMIAMAAFQNWKQGKRTKDIQASSHTTIAES